MAKTILTYGLIAGLIAGGLVSLSATVLSHDLPGWAGWAVGYLSMLVALTAIVVAVKRERDAAGAIGFWRAFGLGLGITVVASILYALCWEVALVSKGGPDAFIDGYAASLRRHGNSAGAAEMEGMRAMYRNPLLRLPMTMIEIAPVGALVSFVVALVLRNPRVLPARRLA